MAKSKGGCMGAVFMVGTFIALAAMIGPAVKNESTAFIGLIASVVVLIGSIVMALVYKKPEFEDESFGHMCKRWFWGAVGAAALGAVFFFVLAPKVLSEATDNADAEAGQSETVAEDATIEK